MGNDYVVDGFADFYVKSSEDSQDKEAYIIKAQINFKVNEQNTEMKQNEKELNLCLSVQLQVEVRLG